MRVSHRSIFDNLVMNLNQSSSRLLEVNQQAATQKRINAPSDDPTGTSRVLNLRDSLGALDQYKDNIDTARGWLGLSDETLLQVQNVVTRLKELGVQGSTGTYTAKDREAIAFEARQLFEELIRLANTSIEGASIYAGHKVNGNAFEERLFVTSNDGAVASDDVVEVTGGSDTTILVQFLEDGTVGTDDIDYRYSSDGGNTWQTATLTAPATTLDLGSVQVELDSGVAVTGVDDFNDTDGSWLWVRPSAEYLGDDEDDITVDIYSSTITGAEADGLFSRNVALRIDDTGGAEDEYSYSLDGGRSWVTGNLASGTDFWVPGGIISVTGGATADGDQIIIRPNRAAIDVEIAPDQTVQLNQVGKDIFGGLYQGEVVFESEGEQAKNLFETVGELVGYLETNNQEGTQNSLENLSAVGENISNFLAQVGARENRLDVSSSVLEGLELTETERLSNVEDVDMAEIMTELTKQQIIYEAVLKSSSMIMRMTLVDFI